MWDDPKKMQQLSKWIIKTVSICILIFLSMRYIDVIAEGVSVFINLLNPLFVGIFIAIILNIPVSLFENRLFQRIHSKKLRRGVAIVFAIVLVVLLLLGIFILVVPELVAAVQLIVQVVSDTIDQLSLIDKNPDAVHTLWGGALAQFDIDWSSLKIQMNEWFQSQKSAILNGVFAVTSLLVSEVAGIFIGFIFSIYILYHKEKLTKQICRLIDAWLPKGLGTTLTHCATVCHQSFRNFMVGQTTEAVILGTLCGGGMAILQIPYASIVGVLVGVTAMIPIFGAFIGGAVGAVLILAINPIKAVIFVVYLVILQQIEGNIIYPKVVGAKVNLDGMWVLLAVTVGGSLAGPLGMLIGVPVISAGYTLLKEATEYRECSKVN